MKRRALITGIAGQDGSYLCELLLERNYEVHGTVRHVALEDPDHRLWRLKNVKGRIRLHAASVESYSNMSKVLKDVSPHEVYHLAAVSYISYAFEEEFSTMLTNIIGTYNLLNAVKELVPNCRVYFAGSSEMFGKVKELPQNENTRFRPRSPYGISKTAGFHMAENYREHYGLHICSGIMFNHESPRRGYEFVTRKISRAVARIKLGKQDVLELGNLDAARDWGYAKEYVMAMWLMLQQDVGEDYVIATNMVHTVRDFADKAFSYVGLNWKDHTRVREDLIRPFDDYTLRGDYSKAKECLGWRPSVSFEELVEIMVENDLRLEMNGLEMLESYKDV